VNSTGATVCDIASKKIVEDVQLKTNATVATPLAADKKVNTSWN